MTPASVLTAVFEVN